MAQHEARVEDLQQAEVGQGTPEEVVEAVRRALANPRRTRR